MTAPDAPAGGTPLTPEQVAEAQEWFRRVSDIRAELRFYESWDHAATLVRAWLAGARPAAEPVDVDVLKALAGDIWHAVACGGTDDENLADIYRRVNALLPEGEYGSGRPIEEALAARPESRTVTTTRVETPWKAEQ